MFSNLSSNSISLATVTPSLVIRGAPNPLSNTTLRPFGPSVTSTAAARMSMPRSIFARASTENLMSLADMDALPHVQLAETRPRSDCVTGHADVGPVGRGDRPAALAIRFQFAPSRNFTRCPSAVREVATFQSESFDCCLWKRAPRFDLLIRSHHCTDNCFGRLRILFAHEVDRADGRTAP